MRNWVDANPEDYNAKLELANYLVLAGEQDKAVPLWESVLAVSPEHWVVLTNLSDALKNSDPERSLDYAERAYKLNPGYAPIALTLAEALLANSKEPDRAIMLASSVTKRLPDNVSAGMLLARAQFQNGDAEKARQTLEDLRTKKLAPGESEEIDTLLQQFSR